MTQRPSSSKTSITAGILAGLLAAGLGSYYVHTHPGTAPAAAPSPDRAPDTNERAVVALMALPELKAWSAVIETNSQGASHGAVIESDPAPRLVNGKPYLHLGFIENGPQAAHRWESFLVKPDGSDILVEDSASDELLSLERWRKEQRPLERASQTPAP